MKLVIDADSVVYAAAAAAERNVYAVVREDGQCFDGLDHKTAKAALLDGGQLYHRTELQDQAIAIEAARSMIRTTVNEVRDNTGEAPDVHILLTGYGNYRERLATVIRYKFNRVETKKPAHYGAVRKHLVDELQAELVHWYEADDKCAILQTQDRTNTVVSSIDKDLLQVPGWHWIPGKGMVEVSEVSGLLRLYQQILMGDATDGVPGCKGIGAVKAKAIVQGVLPGVPTDYGPAHSARAGLEAALWAAVKQTYYAADLPVETAIETARLVYLLRAEPKDPAYPQLWTPPT